MTKTEKCFRKFIFDAHDVIRSLIYISEEAVAVGVSLVFADGIDSFHT